MLTLQFALYALAFAVATCLQRRLTRERIEGMTHADHIVHNDRIALARHVELLARETRKRESRRGRR